MVWSLSVSVKKGGCVVAKSILDGHSGIYIARAIDQQGEIHLGQWWVKVNLSSRPIEFRKVNLFVDVEV